MCMHVVPLEFCLFLEGELPCFVLLDGSVFCRWFWVISFVQFNNAVMRRGHTGFFSYSTQLRGIVLLRTYDKPLGVCATLN
jgi:hypothetical protein